LQIFEDPEDPNSVLETWSFKVTYPDTPSEGPQVGIEFTGKEGQVTTLANARENMKQTVRSIAKHCNEDAMYLPCTFGRALQSARTLALIPHIAKRYLHVCLWYTAERNENYRPNGFDDCDLEDIHFPTQELCDVQSMKFRAYQDGLHR